MYGAGASLRVGKSAANAEVATPARSAPIRTFFIKNSPFEGLASAPDSLIARICSDKPSWRMRPACRVCSGGAFFHEARHPTARADDVPLDSGGERARSRQSNRVNNLEVLLVCKARVEDV